LAKANRGFLTYRTRKIGVNVKKNNLLQGAILALLVSSPLAAFAGQYPAADFEPKILYQDESAKSATQAPVKATPAPAAVAVSEDDSKYPATNFQPKVLFSDASYKHDKSAPSLTPTSASSESSSYSTSAGAVVMEQSKSESGSNDSNLLILAVLAAIGGFVLFNKKGGSTASNETVYANRETGVTRYLNARVPKVSGVTKYLERAGKPTNVARYIAKQNIAQKAAQNDTDRG
jgi:hypothetical protein